MNTRPQSGMARIRVIPLKQISWLAGWQLMTAAAMLAQGDPIALAQPGAAQGDRPRVANGTGRAVDPEAQAFPLSAVKLLDGPFEQAMATDKSYLLRLDPDRLLAGFRREAGLSKKADPYGGWETIPETGRYSLAGQALGHYLSALSLMTSATGDAECGRRVKFIVAELSECQKAAGTGILCAFPESKQLFSELAAGTIKSDHLFNLNGGYVPLYVTHKVMAGLRDAWLRLGNRDARDVLVRMADWLGTVVKDLSDAQIREMLETEHGGIMEVMADVYAMTGEPRYLALAKRLNHQSLFDPLTRDEDVLNGLHANAQIPKAIGMERIHQLTGEPAFGRAARSFWDNVVHTRTFVIGGHGAHEFFFEPDAFATRGITSSTGPETCNTYNMLKLSRQLWLAKPSGEIADFIERALYNHILPSQEPDRGGLVYFTSMRPGHYRTYSSDTDDFWCCTDTGMESHAKYGEFIYAHSQNRLWVDLLIPSELDWAGQGLKVRLETRFPEDGKATIRFRADQPRDLEIAVRCPSWLKPGDMKLAVNGSAEAFESQPGSYAVVRRTWKTGDKIDVEWPLGLRTEMLPQSQEWITVLWGPVVLAGELGREGLETLDFSGTRNYVATEKLPVERAPVFVGKAEDVPVKIKPVPGESLRFRTAGLALPAEVSLAPFYRVHRQRYAVYWRLMSAGLLATPEFEAAEAAEQAGNHAAALLRYETLYDSTVTDDATRAALRAKFAALRPKLAPNTDPQHAGTWKVKAFAFRELDFTWKDKQGTAHHAHHRYRPDEMDRLKRSMTGFAERVWKYTDGNLRIDWELKVVEKPLTRLDGEDSFWPGPDACMPYLTDLKTGDADTLMVFVKAWGDPAKGETSEGVPEMLLGGALGALGEFTKHATYIGFNWGSGVAENEPDGEPMLHEWLHSAQWTLEDYQGYPRGLMFTSDGGRMDGETGGDPCYRRKKTEPSWMGFYEHLMRDHVTRRMWRELSLRRPPDNVWANTYCRSFLVLGPFAAAGKPAMGLDSAFIDERARTVAPGAKDGEHAWRAAHTDNHTLDIIQSFGSEPHQVAYVAARVRSTSEQPAQLRIGSDDGCKVWHNGNLVLSAAEPRAAEPDQNVVDVTLAKGENLFLMKVANGDGGWEAILRVTNRNGGPLPGVAYVEP